MFGFTMCHCNFGKNFEPQQNKETIMIVDISLPPKLEDCVAPLPLPFGAALFRAGRLDSLSYANIRCSRLLNN
jgi:hypothetical protein